MNTSMNTSAKILSFKKALAFRRRAARAGKKAVFTNGCFDILHAGHVVLLEKARELGGVLIVGVNSDASVRRLKGPARPLTPLADRVRVLAALAAVDAVVVFSEDTPRGLIQALRPDVLVKGADYAGSDIVGREFSGRTVRMGLLKGRSTTGLIKKILSALR